MRLRIRDREFKIFSLGLFAGFVCCYFIAGTNSERKVTQVPLMVAPVLTATQTAVQPPMPLVNWTDSQVRAVLQPRAKVTYSTVRPPFAKGPAWGWTIQEAGPIQGHATLDQILDEFNRRECIDFSNRRDLTNYRRSIGMRLKALR
jgi:hypothetical protein